MVEPLQESRSAGDYFTVYSSGGGLFDSRFLEIMVKCAKMSPTELAVEAVALSAEETAFVSVLRILSSVPNMRDSDEICSVLLWMLQCKQQIRPLNGIVTTTLKIVYMFIVVCPEVIKTAKSLISQSSAICHEVRDILKEISRLQSSRGHNKAYEGILFSELRNVRLLYCSLNLLNDYFPPLNTIVFSGIVI